MKLTETKLKQMILDEIKSNLSPADKRQLESDIESVKKIKVELEVLRKERDRLGGEGSTEMADSTILGITHDPSSEIGQVDRALRDINNQLLNIAKKYNIDKWFTAEELINRMQKKFRRKSL